MNGTISDWSVFGGDSTHRDWRRFRPLGLSREEDWSDRLAFLIESSTSGLLAHGLVGSDGAPPQDYALPDRVERETLHEGYRSDLVVR